MRSLQSSKTRIGAIVDLFIDPMPMKFFILVVLSFLCKMTIAETTIWDELPASQNARFKYFKKNDKLGVFKAYQEMRGTKYIFACVNAFVFHLYAYQDDSIEDSEVARKKSERKCAETYEIPNSTIRFPYGTLIFLRFEIGKDPAEKIYGPSRKAA